MQLYITLLGVFKTPNKKNEDGVDSLPPGINGPKYPGISRETYLCECHRSPCADLKIWVKSSFEASLHEKL